MDPKASEPTGSTLEQGPGGAVDEAVEYCYGHPKTPTKLHCTRCDRPICGRCAIPASVGQHCPECVAEARKSARKVRSAAMATAPAVMVILGINIVIFLLQRFVPGLTEALYLEPFAIAGGQWYRLLTPMILHAGLLHIFFNCYVLYMLGPNVEQAFGTARFVLMYVVAGFVASSLSFAFPPDSPSLGASGAIFGIAGVLFVYLFKRRRSSFVRGYLRQIAIFIGVNLLFGFLFPFVDNYAHIGGLIGGMILGLGFDRDDALVSLTSVLATLVALGLGAFLVFGRIGGFGPF